DDSGQRAGALLEREAVRAERDAERDLLRRGAQRAERSAQGRRRLERLVLERLQPGLYLAVGRERVAEPPDAGTDREEHRPHAVVQLERDPAALLVDR